MRKVPKSGIVTKTNGSATKTKAKKRRSRIGPGEPLFDALVEISNEHPGYLTLSKAATLLHRANKYTDVKWSNLRNQCKTRLERLINDHNALKKRKEDRIDPVTGQKEGFRYVYYQEGHDGVAEGEKLSSDDMEEILANFKETGDSVVDFVVERLESVNQHKTLDEYKDDFIEQLSVELGDRETINEWAKRMKIPLDPTMNARNQLINVIKTCVDWLFEEIKRMVMV